jgi:hypothetical protein
MMEPLRQQMEGVDPEAIRFGWLGLRLNAEHKKELDERVGQLLEEFMQREPDPDGDAYSFVVVTHPEHNPPADR